MAFRIHLPSYPFAEVDGVKYKLPENQTQENKTTHMLLNIQRNIFEANVLFPLRKKIKSVWFMLNSTQENNIKFSLNDFETNKKVLDFPVFNIKGAEHGCS